MKRFRPLIWRGLVATSVLLLIMSVAAWITGGIWLQPKQTHRLIGRWEYSFSGAYAPYGDPAFQFLILHSWEHPIVGPAWRSDGYSTPALDQWLKKYADHQYPTHHGFGLDYGAELGGGRGQNALMLGARLDVVAPYWGLTLLFAILPAISIGRASYRRYKKTHHNPGTCRSCGYDLRATPHRCPECGTIPAKKVPVPA